MSATSTLPLDGASELPHHDGVRRPPSEAPYYVAAGQELDIFAMCHARGLPA